MARAETSPLRASLALRWTVLRRRHVSPLEGVILAALTGLAHLVGRELGAGPAGDRAIAAALTGLLCLWWVGGARLARRLLYGARELALLMPGGLPPRQLVRLRFLELALLHGAALVPLLGGVLGLHLARGRTPSWLALAAIPALAALLSAAGLLGGWLAARAGGATRPLAWAAGLAIAATFALAPAEGLDLLGGAASPGALLLDAARGAPSALVACAVLAAALASLADLLAARGYGRAVDRSARRAARTPGALWQALGPAVRPLGQQTGALLRRDLVLLARGAFLRGVLVLALLPLGLGVVRLLAREPATRDWQLSLAGLLVVGVCGSAAGFLFGVDFPRARRGRLLLERAQPVRGRAVLISRWLPAAAYGALLATGAAALVGAAPRAALNAQAWPLLLAGVLLAVVVTHHAVCYGMRSEAGLDPAEAAAYPLNGGVVAILFAALLLVHPLLVLLYPMVWTGFARRAVRRWETAEVEALHEAAA